jgi:hypothetical protein
MSNLSVNIGPVSHGVLVPCGGLKTAACGHPINLIFVR